MSSKKEYATKQKNQLRTFFAKTFPQSYTAKQLIDAPELALGKATIYRLLTKLTQEGSINRTVPAKGRATSYQYNPVSDCHNHLHLKCSDCCQIVCVECVYMKHFQTHVKTNHAFTVTQEDTIIYGRCDKCNLAFNDQLKK